jgi:glycosyltransferase involved in cell wall biosynthesis
MTADMNDDRSAAWLHERFGRFVEGGVRRQERRLNVAFLLGSPAISGGNNSVLQHALYLQQRGHDVVLATTEPTVPHGNWHPAFESVPLVSVADVGDQLFDVVVATWWVTALHLDRLRFRHAVYFIQSIESRFYERDIAPTLGQAAEATYSLGLHAITVASWMQLYLAVEHRAPSSLVLNGIDKELFSLTGPAIEKRLNGGVRVLVEGRFDVAMKGVGEALTACAQSRADETWYLSPGACDVPPTVDRFFSALPQQDVPAVFRSCDVLVKLSRVEGMYGPPLEMFHCGGTVATWPTTGMDEYIEDGFNALVVPMEETESVVAAINKLVDNPDLMNRLKANAYSTATTWPSWQDASRRFHSLLVRIADLPAQDQGEIREKVSAIRAAMEMRT